MAVPSHDERDFEFAKKSIVLWLEMQIMWHNILAFPFKGYEVVINFFNSKYSRN
jgi:hypothetical protein